MSDKDLIKTGIDKLDILLEGGIPKGFTTLILSSPGSSSEILCKQLASNNNTLYITTEETKDEILKTMKRFNWENSDIDFVDIATLYSNNIIKKELKRVSILEQKSKNKLKELIKLGSNGIAPKKKEDEDFLAVMYNKIKYTKYNSIIINSIDFFHNIYNESEVLRTIQASKIQNLNNNGALFLIMNRGIHGELFERKIEGIADCILELEVIQKGSSFDRFLAVKKMRNYAKKIGIARYTIDSDGFVLEMIERIM